MIKLKEIQSGLFIGNRWVQNCEKHCGRLEVKNSRALIGFIIFTKQQNLVPVLQESRDVLLYTRAFQGHTGGTVIAPQLMGHVTIPWKWKELLFHRGCSYDVTSIFMSGLIAGGRESKEGSHTIFFALLNPFGGIQMNMILAMTFRSRESTPPQQVEKSSGRRTLDQFSPSRRRRTTIVADKIPCRDCMLCASRFRLQGDFSKKGRKFIRKTLDASGCPDDGNQDCLAITAATAAARLIGEFCFGHQETCAKRGPRLSNRQPRTTEHLETDRKCLVTS